MPSFRSHTTYSSPAQGGGKGAAGEKWLTDHILPESHASQGRYKTGGESRLAVWIGNYGGFRTLVFFFSVRRVR